MLIAVFLLLVFRSLIHCYQWRPGGKCWLHAAKIGRFKPNNYFFVWTLHWGVSTKHNCVYSHLYSIIDFTRCHWKYIYPKCPLWHHYDFYLDFYTLFMHNIFNTKASHYQHLLFRFSYLIFWCSTRIRPDKLRDREDRWHLVGRFLETWCDLYHKEQSFLVEVLWAVS